MKSLRAVPLACRNARVCSRIRKLMVPADCILISVKKEESGIFPFTCPVTAFPVSYRGCLTLSTASSTSPLGHPGLSVAICICVVGLFPLEHFCSFYFGPPKTNGSNSNSVFALIA